MERLIADISAMAYIYKSYYGRFIMNELGETDDKWKFNKNEHKYKRKTDGDLAVEKEISDMALRYKERQVDKIKEEFECDIAL